MLLARKLTYSYPGGGEVLAGVSFALEPGTLLALAGAHGSGKSTLLAILAGLLEPTGGTLKLAAGADVGTRELRSFTRLVMQDPDAQLLGGTVGEDLLLGGDPRDSARVARARREATRFGLDERWSDPLQTLSWGMKRKLCLAAAQMQEPRVMLLDDPFSGLDSPAVREMRTILHDNRVAGITQVVAVYDLDPLLDLCDGLAVLHQGRLALAGDPAKLLPKVSAYGVHPPTSWVVSGEIVPWDAKR